MNTPPPFQHFAFQHVLSNLDAAQCYVTQNRSGYKGCGSVYSMHIVDTMYQACAAAFVQLSGEKLYHLL